MAWNVTNLLGATIGTVDSSPNWPLGMKATARNTTSGYMGEFMYMKGAATTAAGTWALLNYDDGTTTLLVDGAIGPVGIATAATIASTYGWYQVQGKASGKLIAGTAEDLGLYAQITSSAGMAGVTSAGMSEIKGAASAQATTSAAAIVEVEINYPVVGLKTG